MRIIGNDPTTPRQAQIVASGTLSTGDAVVVNADGTVSVTAGSAEAIGTPVVFNAGSTPNNINAVYDANSGKVVMVYQESSVSGNAIVGTVSGTSITFGTEVVFESAQISSNAAVYDPIAQKVVIIYTDLLNSSYGTAIVGTVSGTSISFGSPVVFESDKVEWMGITYDSSASSVVVAYKDVNNSNYGTAIVGAVSGTSISFGTPVVFESSNFFYPALAYDSNAQKVVIAYRDSGNSNYGTAIVGTVSGTSISFGTAVVFNTATTNYISAVYDPDAQKVVLAYHDAGNSNYGTVIVGTVSGTSISFGSSVVFNTARADWMSAVYDPDAQKVIIAYEDYGNSNYGTLVVGTVSGTSISFESPVVFENGEANSMATVYDTIAKETVIAYSNNLQYGTSVVYKNASTNLTAENYIGFADSGYANGQSAAINSTCTVDRNQSGLTAGQTYYVQADGSLGTAAADPSVVAGTAISSTEIIVKG